MSIPNVDEILSKRVPTLRRPRDRRMSLLEQAKIAMLAYEFARQVIPELEAREYRLMKWWLGLAENTDRVEWISPDRNTIWKEVWVIDSSLTFVSSESLEAYRLGWDIFVRVAPWFQTRADHAKVIDASLKRCLIAPDQEMIEIGGICRRFNSEGREIRGGFVDGLINRLADSPIYLPRDW